MQHFQVQQRSRTIPSLFHSRCTIKLPNSEKRLLQFVPASGTSPGKESACMNRTHFLLLPSLKNPTLLQHLYSEIQLSGSILQRNGKELCYKTQFIKCQLPRTPEVHESIKHLAFLSTVCAAGLQHLQCC